MQDCTYQIIFPLDQVHELHAAYISDKIHYSNVRTHRTLRQDRSTDKKVPDFSSVKNCGPDPTWDRVYQSKHFDHSFNQAQDRPS